MERNSERKKCIDKEKFCDIRRLDAHMRVERQKFRVYILRGKDSNIFDVESNFFDTHNLELQVQNWVRIVLVTTNPTRPGRTETKFEHHQIWGQPQTLHYAEIQV